MDRKADIDSQETKDWIEALESLLEREGVERAHYLLEKLIDKARRSGVYLPYSANTAYINSIPPSAEPHFPGNRALERRITTFIRWNAMAMVVKANKKYTGRSYRNSGHTRKNTKGFI